MSVRHALLALLSEGPKYGLQLREEFEARTGEVWPLNVGQVYATLQRLERDGLVAAAGEDPVSEPGTQGAPQKAYEITEVGSAELAQWLRVPAGQSTPPRRASAPRSRAGRARRPRPGRTPGRPGRHRRPRPRARPP
jgi:DNA-binding PadR family transcriptional regulator